ncbi:MAG: GreA/GreB family elongation factor [Bacteroidales bacterium]|nr:GreA/GreB family elongation factor [Bacteroidales bacterium]
MERYLTYRDYSYLINLITDDLGKAHVSPHGLHTLYLLAENSIKYDSNNIPCNIVTLNSEIILVSEKMQKQLVRIVLPMNLNGKNDISVYSPIGIACLGKREKDFVYIKHKNCHQKLQIEKILFQPEKEKVYYL